MKPGTTGLFRSALRAKLANVTRPSLRQVVYFSTFISMLWIILALRRYHQNDFTDALLSTRPSHPQNQQQIFYFTTREFNGFGAQALHLIDVAAVAQLMKPPARVCITQGRYWNYGCAPHKGWACYFSSAICDLDDVDDMTTTDDASAVNPDEEKSAKLRYENCIELANVNPVVLWSTPCVRVSSRASQRRAASITRRLASSSASPITYMRSVAEFLWKLNRRTARAVEMRIGTVGLGSVGVEEEADPELANDNNMKDEMNERTGEDINDQEIASHSSSSSHLGNFVAIHIRRGDKIREVRPVSLRAYADAVTLLARAGEQVFVATDDGSVIEHMRELLRPRHEVFTLGSVGGRKGHRQGQVNRASVARRYELTLDLLAEIELMRRARVFIATFSSNLARLVHVLRTADERNSISLDDRWAPGVAWPTFGQGYCNWPGANETFCKMWEAS